MRKRLLTLLFVITVMAFASVPASTQTGCQQYSYSTAISWGGSNYCAGYSWWDCWVCWDTQAGWTCSAQFGPCFPDYQH